MTVLKKLAIGAAVFAFPFVVLAFAEVSVVLLFGFLLYCIGDVVMNPIGDCPYGD